jgi:hypothetical protein
MAVSKNAFSGLAALITLIAITAICDYNFGFRMNPTGWGWITALWGLTCVALVFVTSRTAKIGGGRGLQATSSVCVDLGFLFCFMQWAEWYK